MTPAPLLPPDNAAERAAAAKRLKSAWTSMIFSAVFTVLLLVWIGYGIASGRYAHIASGGQGTIFAIVAVVIAIRLGYRAYRLYTTWNSLKAAQAHHRSFN